ncbi:MAG: sulfatase-like hydrolase/transferase [bacterium]
MKLLKSWSILIFINIVAAITLYFYFKSDFISLTKGKESLFIFYSTLGSVAFSFLILWVLGVVLMFFVKLRATLITFAVLSSLLFIFFYIDAQTFVTTGIHLYSSFVVGNLVQKNILNELNFEFNTVAAFVLFFLLVITFNVMISIVAAKLETKFKAFNIFGFISIFSLPVLFVGTALFFAFKWGVILKDEGNEVVPFFLEANSFFEEAKQEEEVKLRVNYPFKKLATANFEKKPDILMIFVESLRSDVFNARMMNSTFGFAKENCLISKNHHSSELSTIYNTFALLYGLNIHYYYPFYFSKSRSVPIQILKNNGYTTIGAAASNLKNMSIHSTVLYDQFDTYREFNVKGWRKDREMVDWIKKLSSKNSPKPHFYFMFFQSTHHNYYYPPEFEKYSPVIEPDFNYFKGATLKEKKELVKNRYFNAVLYVDSLISELLDHFKEKIESGEMVVVVTGDHGEEFWDAGALGHGKISNNFRSSVPFAICLPEVGKGEIELSTHIDIFPTVIRHLSPKENIGKWSDGVSLFDETATNRYITVSGFDFPRRSREVTLINRDGKLFLRKTTDSVNLKNEFKVIKRSDLQDNTDNTLARELDWMIEQFATDMNRFFLPM